MSWKSLVSAGLLSCLLAVSAWAVPSAQHALVLGPDDPGPAIPVLLNADGHYQWQVTVTPDATQVTGGNGVVGAELAYLVTGTGLANASNNNVAQWDRNNPGLRPTGFGSGFAWLVNGPFGDPEGVQTNPTTDEVYASLGSIDFVASTPSNYIMILATGPAITGDSDSVQATPLNLRQTTVQQGGAYAGSTGVLAQTPIVPNTLVSSSQTYSAIVADANLNGEVDLADFNIVINNFGVATQNWNLGNFNNIKSPLNNGAELTVQEVDLADFNNVINNFGDTVPGGGGVSVVPEPASMALVLMALVMGLAARRR